jgi:hypothetical protein
VERIPVHGTTLEGSVARSGTTISSPWLWVDIDWIVRDAREQRNAHARPFETISKSL